MAHFGALLDSRPRKYLKALMRRKGCRLQPILVARLYWPTRDPTLSKHFGHDAGLTDGALDSLLEVTDSVQSLFLVGRFGLQPPAKLLKLKGQKWPKFTA